MKVTLHCAMCPAQLDLDAPDPEGWSGLPVRAGTDVEGRTFCPDHAGAGRWVDDQCPGCVASFGTCGLTDAFMYRHRRTITADHLATIGCGTCPFRTNGTIGVFRSSGGTTITDMDLSEQSDDGEAMVQAIRDYIDRWPAPPWNDLAPWGTERTDDQGRRWTAAAGSWELKPT